ncbi:MAG: ABC transporter permease [Cellulosilyticaceae bacterium]
MENILKLMKHNIKMFLREPWGIGCLVLPIVMSVVMIKMLSIDSMSVQGTIGIFFTQQNQEVVQQLSKNLAEENIAVNLYEGEQQVGGLEEEAREKLNVIMQIDDVDLVQAMAEGQKAIKITYKEADNSSEIVKQSVEKHLSEMQQLAKVSEGDHGMFQKLNQVLEVQTKDIILKQDGVTYMSSKQGFGIFVMLLLLSGGYNLKTMAREKESKVYERIVGGPVKKYEYILGHVGGSFVLLSLQVVLEWLALVSLKVNFDLGIGTFLIIGLVLALVSIGVGLLLLAVSKSANVFGMLLGFVVPPMAMLSDCIFPIEFLPNWIDKMSLVFPLRWIMEGYNTALSGGSLMQLLGCLLLASVLAVVLILLSIIIEGFYQTE